MVPKNQDDLRQTQAGMNRKQFLNRLCHYTVQRYDERVTDRMLRTWCEQGFISEPTKSGLGRGKGTLAIWGAEQYRQACRICQLRKQGVRSLDALRILLWLSGQHTTVKNLRRSCIQELQRIRSSRNFSTRSLMDPTGQKLAPKTIKSLARDVGQLDPRLVPGFNYSDVEKVEMIASLKGGETNTSFVVSLVKAVIPKLNNRTE